MLPPNKLQHQKHVPHALADRVDRVDPVVIEAKEEAPVADPDKDAVKAVDLVADPDKDVAQAPDKPTMPSAASGKKK